MIMEVKTAQLFDDTWNPWKQDGDGNVIQY